MDSKTNRDPEYTRRQLIIAARREFNSVGYFGTDTNKIAKLAGFAPGSFYRHFKDKIAIFIEIYQDWHVEQMQEIERALSLGGSIDAMSERLTDIVINFYGNWRPLRASARMLRISEPRVADYHLERRGELLANIVLLRSKLKLKPLPKESLLVFLILIERLGDAVADGEFEIPTLPKDSGRNAVKEIMFRFLRGKI